MICLLILHKYTSGKHLSSLFVMNYIFIFMRIIYYDIHMNVTNCGWFLHMLECPLIVKEFTWMRASNSDWSIQKLCVVLGSRLTVIRLFP